MLRMRFHIRTVIIAIQMLLVLLAGGTVGYFSYTMEIDQSRGDMVRVLGQTSQDITTIMEIYQEQVQTGGILIGKMAEKGHLQVENKNHLAQVFTGYCQGIPLIAAMGYIDAATGSATYVGRQPDQTIMTRVTQWDPGQKAFYAKSYLENDLNWSSPVNSALPFRDPRGSSYFMAFKNLKSPEWIHVRSPEESLMGGPASGFSFGYPIWSGGNLLQGLLVLEMDLATIGDNLKNCGAKLGYGGSVFALKKNDRNEITVIGQELESTKAVPSPGTGAMSLAQSRSNSSVQAFEKFLAQRMAQGLDPFNDPGEVICEFKCSQGMEWVCVSRPVSPGIPPDWMVVSLARKDLLYAESFRRLKGFMVALVLILVGTSVLGFWLSGFLSRRLNVVSKDANLVRSLQIVPAVADSHFVIEIDHLVKAMEEMKAGLLSFQKFVPSEVVRKVVASGKEALPGGEDRILTLLFTDLADFTAISEKLSPEKVVSLVSDHLAMGSNIVKDFGGTLDKFIGDSIMAFWNAPDLCEDHANRAVLAALQIQQKLDLSNAYNRERGMPELKMRIGMNTGHAVVGNIGTETRLNYTALGDTVNLASRLEAANKYYGTRNLVAENTVALLPPGLVFRPVDCLAVWGKTQGLVVYEALGKEGACPDNLVQLARQTEEAWSLYRLRDWPAAASAYEKIRDQFQQDSMAATMAQRCRKLEKNPPKPDWDGTWRLADK